MDKKDQFSRDNHPRSAEDLPFFPLAVAKMSQGQYVDEIAEAQHDFVRMAGLPSLNNETNKI